MKLGSPKTHKFNTMHSKLPLLRKAMQACSLSRLAPCPKERVKRVALHPFHPFQPEDDSISHFESSDVASVFVQRLKLKPVQMFQVENLQWPSVCVSSDAILLILLQILLESRNGVFSRLSHQHSSLYSAFAPPAPTRSTSWPWPLKMRLPRLRGAAAPTPQRSPGGSSRSPTATPFSTSSSSWLRYTSWWRSLTGTGQWPHPHWGQWLRGNDMDDRVKSRVIELKVVAIETV